MKEINKKSILFVMPDEREVYKNVPVKAGAFHTPSLAFAILAAVAKQNGYSPVILDLGICADPPAEIKNRLNDLKPVCLAITCTSATYRQAVAIAKAAKSILPAITVIVGGPHVSSEVEFTMQNACFDYVFIGEADISLAEFLRGTAPKDIKGLSYRDSDGKVVRNPQADFLRRLDEVPIPDYGMYELSKYPVSGLQAKQNPVVWIETSRGCPFNCQICNKVVHGQTFRPKSPERVMSEIETLLKLGIKEFHIADDGFTSDMTRAEKICDEIIARKLKFTWACLNGIRVDRVSEGLLKKMKQAGCYRVSFGIESGNQKVLNNLGKGIKLDAVVKAVRLARSAGLEVFGYFIFGFEDDTEESMEDTINFALSLPLDLAKASIMMPFPGSPLYTKYVGLNLLYPVGDFEQFNAYTSPAQVYKHPRLDWAVVEKYQRNFYRRFYFNPKYMLRRLLYAVKTGSIIDDLTILLKTKWLK